MTEQAKIEQDRATLADVQGKGLGAKLRVYTKLSGPGWLQSAITLGGGSLAGSLYIGVIGGYKMLWLQPMMMILGIIMLSAIAYVTLSTGEKPFRSINQHVNPVLGWGWLIAAMIANLVWAMPQFSLGTAALQQNLGFANVPDWACTLILFVIAGAVIWFYDAGGWGIKLFEIVLKIMVALIVLAFFGVVVSLTFRGALPWGEVLLGFVPDFSLLSEPAAQLRPYIEASSNPDYWSAEVVSIQQNTMITAAATAVGINMTFLLPYSMLRKGWDKTFRGLATFDLSTGLFIPFVLATSCVVIAAVSQFHAVAPDAVALVQVDKMSSGQLKNLTTFAGKQVDGWAEMDKAQQDAAINTLKPADKQLAHMIVSRDAGALAGSLENVTGSKAVAQYVFGLGVLGMAVSTIIILMLINGFTFTEALGVKTSGPMHRVGSYLPAFTGALGFLLLWSKYPEARFWLAVPTSRIGMILLPIAYITFFLLINNKKVMGDQRPTGGKGLAINAAMLVAIIVSTIGCGYAVYNTTGNIPGTEVKAYYLPLGMIVLLVVLALVAQVMRMAKKPAA